MPVKTIEHALGTITIEYGYNDNPWTEADEELVLALVKRYDHELAMDTKCQAMMDNYSDAKKITDAQQEELGKLRTLLAGIREEADGFREHFGLAVPQSFLDFAGKISEAGKAIAAFDVPFRGQWQRMSGLCDVLRAYTEESENDYMLRDEYADVKCRHNEDYEHNSIDPDIFDLTNQKMGAMASVHSKSRNDKRECCHNYFDDHEYFVLEVIAEYRVWEEFLKRFKLMEYIFGEKMLRRLWVN